MESNSTYFDLLERQRVELDKVANYLEKLIPADAELLPTNFSDISFQAWQSILVNERMANAHKYHRMSKEEFTSYLAGDKIISSTTIHTRKSYETLRSIALLYDVDEQEILEANNIDTVEFESMMELLIPLKRENEVSIYREVPTFGAHNGIAVLGKDMKLDGEIVDGDFLLLDEFETLKQGLYCLITTESGNVPFDESFGGSPRIGEEYPSDIFESMFSIKLLQGLEQDKRVQSVENLVLSKSGNSVNIDLSVIPINSNDIVEVST